MNKTISLANGFVPGLLDSIGNAKPLGSFCLEGLQCFSTVRHHSLPLRPYLFLQDSLMTFEEELNFVWRVGPRFSMVKLLFIAVGHVTLESGLF